VRIAVVGTRGIPARYGGFETFAEEISRRLVLRGHEVRVYTRQSFSSKTYLGVDLCYLPAIRHKYLETLSHAFLSTLHLLVRRMDVALYCNAANAVFTWMPRFTGMPVALNVDGLERKRKKWNRLARDWYLLSERLSTMFPSAIVTDAEAIRGYYSETYNANSTMISYGAEVEDVPPGDAIRNLNLTPGRYFLYVSRLEPENNALLVRESFERLSEPDIKLALIGDAPYAPEYVTQVRDTRDPRVVIPGAIYGAGYAELQSNCFAYIHATEVGGTHPALIEAMGRGALVLYLENRENAEVAQGVGLPFTQTNLQEVMRSALAMSEAKRDEYRRLARKRVLERYSWEAVTDAYEKLLGELCSARG